MEEEGKGGVGELAFGGALYVMVSAVIVFLLIFGEGGIGFLFTVLFAPLGCWGRWGLAFLNRAECWVCILLFLFLFLFSFLLN